MYICTYACICMCVFIYILHIVTKSLIQDFNQLKMNVLNTKIKSLVFCSCCQGRSHDFLGGQVYFAPSRSYLYFTLRKELLKRSSSYKMHNLFQFCTNNTCKQSMSQLGGLVACHHRKF